MTDDKHTWEDATNTWEGAVAEDEDGNLITSRYNTESVIIAIRKRRIQISQRDYAQSSRRIVRDMIRYLYLIIDISSSMRDKDSSLSSNGKTRLEIVLSNIALFIEQYYDQNPLSHLGMILCRNGEAEILTQLSGNPKLHKNALIQLANKENGTSNNTGGVFSLQNALEVAGRSLGHMPLYGSREIFLIISSLSTSDPGDVLVETLPRLIQGSIRFSCVSLCAELYVCSRIADGTHGMMGVCLDQNHLKDLIMGQCIPPPTTNDHGHGDGDGDGDSHHNNRGRCCEFVQMGFPARETSSNGVPSLIHDTKKMYSLTAYICPRCKAKVSDLPTDCNVCGLKLVLAPHLARSFHHLFPVSSFIEFSDALVYDLMLKDNHHRDNDGDSMVVPPITSSSSSGANNGHDAKHLKSIRLDESLLLSSNDCPACCYSCLKHLLPYTIDDATTTTTATATSTTTNKSSSSSKNKKKQQQQSNKSSNSSNNIVADVNLRFQCPECKNIFCADCDAYLHDTLHNCPGCLCIK